MIYKVVIGFVIFMSGLHISFHTPPPDWQLLALRGSVHKITQRTFEAATKDSVPVKKNHLLDPLENWTIEFNKKGFINSKKCFGFGSDLLFYYEYKYKKKTRLTTRRMYDASDNLIEQSKFVYNDIGQLAAESIYNGFNSLLVRYVYEHNPKGFLMRTDVHAPVGSPYTTAYYKYSYNKSGQKVCQQTFKEPNILYQVDSFFYDANGHLKRQRIISPQSGFEFVSHSNYNDLGDLITLQEAAKTEPTTSFTYTYDSIGNWTQKLHFKKGILKKVILFALATKFS